MNPIEELLKRYSYKFEKGYPDLTNEKDILLLESILEKMDITSINLRERSSLSTKDLAKPIKGAKDRGEVLLKKIEKEEPLKLIKGNEIKIDPEKSKAFIDGLKAGEYTSLSKTPFYDTEGNSYTIGKLEKSDEFGGKAIARGMDIEDRELSHLLDQIEEAGGKVDIKIGDKIYKNITIGNKPTGSPKADFILHSDDNKASIFISHKDGNSAKDFQQYGGVSEFKTNPEVLSFVEKIKEEIGGVEMIRGGGFKHEIKDENLMLKSIYGINYGASEFGINNIQMLAQGKMNLVKIDDNTYTLKSNHDLINGEIPTGGYTPYLMATFRNGRNDMGLKNARLGIYPVDTRPSAKTI